MADLVGQAEGMLGSARELLERARERGDVHAVAYFEERVAEWGSRIQRLKRGGS